MKYMKIIKKLFFATFFILLFSGFAVGKSNIEILLSDYPYMGDIERTIVLNEVKDIIDGGIDEYDIESIIELAKKRKVSPRGLKEIVSLISQATKLHLYPDLLLNKAKEGLLKRVPEDIIIDALKKRLDYLRTSKLIIDSLNKDVSRKNKEELTLIIVQNLENGISEDIITKLVSYFFKRKSSIDKLRTILNEISALPAIGISNEAILKLGEFFFKKNVSDMGIKEIVDAILLSIKLKVPLDMFSDFLEGAYRYRDYVSLRNAILRFAKKNGKIKKSDKITPTNALPPPPAPK